MVFQNSIELVDVVVECPSGAFQIDADIIDAHRLFA